MACICMLVSMVCVCGSEPVRDFLCIDDPPGPHDSLEESRVGTSHWVQLWLSTSCGMSYIYINIAPKLVSPIW